jgi:hypothetical protein
MNDYITLDGFKYATSANNWKKLLEKPNTVRYTLSGALDITFGSASPIRWVGDVIAPVSARAEGWGTILNLRTSLAKVTSVVFTDHYADSFTVFSVAPLQERSLMNRWDDTNNVFFVPVELVFESEYVEAL